MASITDVAKKAGVSISTVSHVINGTKFVGEALKARVMAAIEELGYQPNEMAASMKRRATNNIGVILPNIRMVFFPDVLKGIEDAAKEHGYKLFYFSTDYDFEKEQEYLSQLKSSWVDGIILDSSCPMEQLEEYQKSLVSNRAGKHVPVVTTVAPFTAKELGVITFDEEKATEQTIEYLIGCGHRDIGLLFGPEHIPMYERNLRGVRRIFEKYGIPFDPQNILVGDYFAESGYETMKQALKKGVSWTALFSVNDQMAIGAMKAIKEAGLSIPGDIAVTGADGIYITSMISPALTTVEYPRYDMGYRAGKMLIDMIQNPSKLGQHIMMEGKLIIRESTDSSVKGDWILTGW